MTGSLLSHRVSMSRRVATLATALIVAGRATIAPTAAAATDSAASDMTNPADVVGDLVLAVLTQTVDNPGITVDGEGMPTVEIEGIPEAGPCPSSSLWTMRSKRSLHRKASPH